MKNRPPTHHSPCNRLRLGGLSLAARLTTESNRENLRDLRAAAGVTAMAGEVVRLCHKPTPAVQGEVRRMLSGVRLSDQAGGDDVNPPTRLLVCPWGSHQTIDGPFLCDAGTAKILPERQRLARADQVTIDFDHSTAFGKNKGQPRHIAGYGTPEVVEGEGIYLASIRWTPEGKKFWANYQDLSPAFLQQKSTGRVTFLDSVALTPRGVIEGLSLFSAEPDESSNPSPTNPPTKTRPMDLTKLKNFLKSRGVEFAEDADAETLMSLAEAEMVKMAEVKPADEPMEMSAARLSKLEAEIATMKSAETTRAKAADDAAKAEIIRQASAEGKVLPPESVIKNMSAEDLRATAAAANATVKTSGGGALNPNNKGGENAVTLSAEDKEIARQCGLGEEDMKKFAAYGEAPVRLA